MLDPSAELVALAVAMENGADAAEVWGRCRVVLNQLERLEAALAAQLRQEQAAGERGAVAFGADAGSGDVAVLDVAFDRAVTQ